MWVSCGAQKHSLSWSLEPSAPGVFPLWIACAVLLCLAISAAGTLVSRAGPQPTWLQCVSVTAVGMLVGASQVHAPQQGRSHFGGVLVPARPQVWCTGTAWRGACQDRQGRSAGGHLGGLSCASKVDGEYQKWRPPVLPLAKKVPTDPHASGTYPKISQ